MKILYVEDDWFFRRELSDMVKRITGIDIRLAGTLEEGLSVIESEKLDLVVSDLNLTDSKEIEGFEIIKAATRKGVKTWAFSSHSSQRVIDITRELGAQKYIKKDFKKVAEEIQALIQ